MEKFESIAEATNVNDALTNILSYAPLIMALETDKEKKMQLFKDFSTISSFIGNLQTIC